MSTSFSASGSPRRHDVYVFVCASKCARALKFANVLMTLRVACSHSELRVCVCVCVLLGAVGCGHSDVRLHGLWAVYVDWLN